MSKETKEYIKSALLTFVAGFALAVVPNIDEISLESFETGAVIGLLFAGVRTGFKLVLEAFIIWYNSRK